MSLIDLKSFRSKSHPWRKIPWGLSRASRKSRLLSSDGISSSPCLSPVRGTLQRQLQSQGVHLSRSVLLHGLCPDHVSGESTRYRSLPSGTAWQALPHGNQRAGFPKYPGQRQQGQGLAHLCGPCALADCHGPQALQQRSVSRRPQRDSLRSGRHNYRFMPILIPLGAFPEDERSYQAPYPVGSARQYPILHPHLRWKTPRGQHPGHHSHRGRRFLYHGQGLPGLRQTPLSFTGCGLFCNQGQVQPKMPTCLLSSSGSEHGPHMRSISPVDRPKVVSGLSRQAASGEILRFRNQKDPGLSNEQLHFTAFDHLYTVPVSLAGRAIFQMDQAKSPDEDFLWHLGECRQDSNMDSCVGLCARGNHEKTAKYSGQSLHNFTGTQRLCFRENAAFSTTCTTRLQKPKE